MSLENLKISHQYFLDRTTLIFGETGTGKSFIMTDILYQLKSFVDQIIVVSPMDRQNHTYDKHMVPPPFIHYDITKELLNNIWERQNAFASVYARANNEDIIKSLFERIPRNDRAHDVIRAIQTKLHDCEKAIPRDCKNRDKKISKMKAEYNETVKKIWKSRIDKYRKDIAALDLSEDEQYTLKYINFNPRLVLVLDDCTDLLDKFKSHPVIKKLFYQGRWAHITALIACHTDKALNPELKKNSFVNIFTEMSCARAYFSRPSNNFDKESYNNAINMCKIAFSPIDEHQKLVWIRDEKRYYKYTAVPHSGFRFGSEHMWEYGEKIQAEKNKLINNKFISDFE